MTEELRPPQVELPPPRPDDPRVGHLLGRETGPESPPACVLVGFPSDEGVRRNGGRPGASGGPGALRERLYRLTPHPRRLEAMHRLLAGTVDLGDLPVTGDVEADQERLGRVLAPHLERGSFVVVLGGGHETTYGHFLAYVEAGLTSHLLNWDAHPDVRELREGRAHSGSPFRQALRHPSGACRSYRVAGLQPHSVAAAHLDFLREHGAAWTWCDELDEAQVEVETAALEPPALVSFDLDAVDGAQAPGVSAPSTGGMGVELWLAAAEAAGTSPDVRSVDVVELNPRVDADGRTARLAAATVWRMLAGLARREEG